MGVGEQARTVFLGDGNFEGRVKEAEAPLKIAAESGNPERALQLSRDAKSAETRTVDAYQAFHQRASVKPRAGARENESCQLSENASKN